MSVQILLREGYNRADSTASVEEVKSCGFMGDSAPSFKV